MKGRAQQWQSWLSVVGLTILPIFTNKLLGQQTTEKIVIIEKIRAIMVMFTEMHDSTEE